jgi:hypothetical protein
MLFVEAAVKSILSLGKVFHGLNPIAVLAVAVEFGDMDSPPGTSTTVLTHSLYAGIGVATADWW